MMKSKWNVSKLLLFTVLFTFLSAQAVFAEASGKITADSVKIRSSADASSSVVGSTEKGKTVSIIGKTTDANGTTWYQVYVDENATGYIRGDLLETSSGTTIPDVKKQAETSSTEKTTNTNTDAKATVTAISGTGTVTPPSTNIRASAVSGDVICTLKTGAVVTITGETTGSDSKKWYQVSFIKDSKNYTGFIRADLVDTTKAAQQTETQTTIENTEQPAAETPAVTTPASTVASNVALKSLTISSGTITPEFSADVTSYTIQADEGTTEIAISGVVADSTSQITQADGFKDLQPGLNAASIVVTAADGTSQTYNFSIICGDVNAQTEPAEEPEQEEDIQIEGAMEEVEEGSADMIDVQEYEKYKALAHQRLLIMCALGFALAVAIVIIINLCLKIHDLKEEAEDEEEDEPEERMEPKRKRKSEAAPLKESLTQKEQEKRAEQKPQKSVMMPDLKAEEAYEADNMYEDDGLDDDFEFEFINLDSKR